MPNGEQLETSVVVLDKIGIYQLPDKNIAVNLLSESESDISKQNILAASGEFGLKDVELDQELDLIPYLILISLFILIFETLYVKLRGDI